MQMSVKGYDSFTIVDAKTAGDDFSVIALEPDDDLSVISEDEPSDADLQMIEVDEFAFVSDGDGAEEADDSLYTEDCFKNYLNTIGRIPRLSAAEEIELARIIQDGKPGAAEARNRLVTANLLLAVSVAKSYAKKTHLPVDDLNSMAVEGLIRAAEKFDYRGFRFSTYATWWIKQSISRGITRETGTFRIPVHMNETLRKVKKAIGELEQKNCTTPTAEEVIAYTGLPEEKVMLAYGAMQSSLSFDASIGEEGEGNLAEVIPDKNAVNPEDAIMYDSLKATIAEALTVLSPKEAMVLKLRFGIDCDSPKTLEEIGRMEEFGVSRERVRQLESNAIRKIRHNRSLREKLMPCVS